MNKFAPFISFQSPMSFYMLTRNVNLTMVGKEQNMEFQGATISADQKALYISSLHLIVIVNVVLLVIGRVLITIGL